MQGPCVPQIPRPSGCETPAPALSGVPPPCVWNFISSVRPSASLVPECPSPVTDPAVPQPRWTMLSLGRGPSALTSEGCVHFTFGPLLPAHWLPPPKAGSWTLPALTLATLGFTHGGHLQNQGLRCLPNLGFLPRAQGGLHSRDRPLWTAQWSALC